MTMNLWSHTPSSLASSSLLAPLPHPRDGIGATLLERPVSREGAGAHTCTVGRLIVEVMSVLI